MSFIQQQLPNGCSKDLVSASMEKLEYFPKSKPSGAVNAKDEGEWLEEMTEKAERGEWMAVGYLSVNMWKVLDVTDH